MSVRRRPVRAELEGFRAGLAHALAALRNDGRPDVEGERRLAEADARIRGGRLDDAEAALVAVDRGLRARTPERELAEYPRGLVSYTPTGGPEAPTPVEEDPLRNRIALLRRLADVRASQGREVDAILATLARAEKALEAGDRATAKRLGDEAHSSLESPDPPPRRARPPRET